MRVLSHHPPEYHLLVLWNLATKQRRTSTEMKLHEQRVSLEKALRLLGFKGLAKRSTVNVRPGRQLFPTQMTITVYFLQP